MLARSDTRIMPRAHKLVESESVLIRIMSNRQYVQRTYLMSATKIVGSGFG